MLLRPSIIKAKDSFSLIGFGTWIGQDYGVGTGTGAGNGFSPGSKSRELLFLFYCNILLSNGTIALSFITYFHVKIWNKKLKIWLLPL